MMFYVVVVIVCFVDGFCCYIYYWVDVDFRCDEFVKFN